MPTYEYACRNCGHTFEIIQSMSDDALTTCPRCEGELRKVFAPPAIAFKGSGFYATDHGKRKPAETSSDAKKKEKKDDAGTGGAKKEGSGSGSSSGSGSGPTSGSKDGSTSGGSGASTKETTS